MVAEKYDEKDHSGFTIKDNVLIGNTYHPSSSGLSKTILDSLSKNPNFVAHIDAHTGETITYAQLKDRSIRCALWLKKQGIGKDDVVGISTPNQINDCLPVLATYYVGAISNPWYHVLTPALARYFFEKMRPKIMFACEESIDLLAQVANEAKIDCKFVAYGIHSKLPSLKDIMAEQTQEEVDNFQIIEPADPKKQPCAIFFSSGTTGTQKGTMLSYATVANSRLKYFRILKGMTCLWYSSMSWITGHTFIVNGIEMNIVRIIHRNCNAEETSRVIQKFKVNFGFLTPSLLTEMCKKRIFSRYDYSSFTDLMTGGSKPPKSVLEIVQKNLPYTLVNNGYGMTEGGGILAGHTTNCRAIDSIGFVIPGVEIKVIDTVTGDKLGPNQSGELVLKSDMMLGYYKEPQKTEEMIDAEGWLHTGDLGHFDEKGEIFITDRLKNVIISQNHHISPSQIEDILLQHPMVKDAAVIGVPHEIDIERPFAFVVKVPDAKISAEELIELPAMFDEHFRLSGGVAFIDKIPFTSTAKKALKELKEMAKAYVQ